MIRLIMKTDFTDVTSVEMFRTHFGYAVRYGLQVESNISLSDAKKEYSNCVAHALGCAGEIDHVEAA